LRSKNRTLRREQRCSISWLRTWWPDTWWSAGR